MRRFATPVLLALTLPLLGACASNDGKYPSLARRDIERTSGALPPPAEPAPLKPLAAGIRARAAELAADVRGAHARFMSRRALTAELVAAARGSAVASETWSVATVALSQLEASRSEALVAVAALDRIHIDERMAGSDVAPLEAILAEAKEILAEEDAVIAALGAQLAT